MTEELSRYEVTMEHRDSGETIPSYTLAQTRDDAYNRVAEMVLRQTEVWGGWWFTVADEPTGREDVFLTVLKAHHGHTVKLSGNANDVLTSIDAGRTPDDLEWQFRSFAVHCQDCGTSLSQQWN